MKKSYVLIKDFDAAYVVATGMPHQPQAFKKKKFKKGEIVNGMLKNEKGTAAFVLVGATLVLPVTVLKEVVTKQIGATTNTDQVSNADGTSTLNTNTTAISTVKRTKYLDAALIGAVLGMGVTYLAEKQGWIATPTGKNKLIGAGIGAALGLYFVYRNNAKKVTLKTTK